MEEIRALYNQGTQVEADESDGIMFLPLSQITSYQVTKSDVWQRMAPSAKGCLLLYATAFNRSRVRQQHCYYQDFNYDCFCCMCVRVCVLVCINIGISICSQEKLATSEHVVQVYSASEFAGGKRLSKCGLLITVCVSHSYKFFLRYYISLGVCHDLQRQGEQLVVWVQGHSFPLSQ